MICSIVSGKGFIMTASGINSGPFLPTWMEIPFLSFNVSCKLKLLRFKKKKNSILKLWGEGGLEPEKTFSFNSVCTWNGNTVCSEAPRKTHN